MTKRARKYIAGNRQKRYGRKRYRLFMENLRKNKGMLDLMKMKWQEARDYLLTAHVHAATGMQGAVQLGLKNAMKAEYEKAWEWAEHAALAEIVPVDGFWNMRFPPSPGFGCSLNKWRS